MKSHFPNMVWLTIGIVLMLFSNGRWIIPMATWIYPIFFLHFMRTQGPFRGLLYLFPAIALVNIISWWKMIPAPTPVYILIAGLALQVSTLSYLADRLLAPRLKGVWSTLVFPTFWCGIEWLTTTFTSQATWVSLTYTQTGNLPLLQFSSLTGIWGISFLITWFAAVVNWAWSQNFEWLKIKKVAISFGCVMGMILLFGSIRLNILKSSPGAVRTASIVQARSINQSLSSCKWNDANAISQYSSSLEDNLLTKTAEAAQSGAKFILWQESAGFIPKEEEKKFIDRAMTLAAQKKIYLLMTLWPVPEDFPKRLIENKLLIIDTTGKIQATYFKSHPAMPEPILKGMGQIPVLETPYGKIAPAICFDAEFQGFIRQAGKRHVDIMFIPANDWKEIDPLHTQMALVRAIENGFALVRPAGQGLSAVADNRGRIIASMDYFTTHEQILYADVPIQHSNTVYAFTGDLFAWLCVAVSLAMILFVVSTQYRPEFKLHKEGLAFEK